MWKINILILAPGSFLREQGLIIDLLRIENEPSAYVQINNLQN